MYFPQHNVFAQNKTPLLKRFSKNLRFFSDTWPTLFVFIASLPCAPDS